jgi:DNA-binding response OmpR family regulator
MEEVIEEMSQQSRGSSQQVDTARLNEGSARHQVGTTPATILLVEDDPSMLEIVSHILEDEGFQVVQATGADLALTALQETRPSLIISDVLMPGMSGFAFYQRVRAESDWSQIPFIFLTARGDKADMRFGMGLGADDYLTKPFEPEDLLIAVHVRMQRAAEMQKPMAMTDGDEPAATCHTKDRTPQTFVPDTAEAPRTPAQG